LFSTLSVLDLPAPSRPPPALAHLNLTNKKRFYSFSVSYRGSLRFQPTSIPPSLFPSFLSYFDDSHYNPRFCSSFLRVHRGGCFFIFLLFLLSELLSPLFRKPMDHGVPIPICPHSRPFDPPAAIPQKKNRARALAPGSMPNYFFIPPSAFSYSRMLTAVLHMQFNKVTTCKFFFFFPGHAFVII